MTKSEAISRIYDHMRIHRIGEYPHKKLGEALYMAVLALRESGLSPDEQVAIYKDRAEKAEAERDKLKARFCSPEPCAACSNYDVNECDGDCLPCSADCPCNGCENYSRWNWNGMKVD